MKKIQIAIKHKTVLRKEETDGSNKQVNGTVKKSVNVGKALIFHS